MGSWCQHHHLPTSKVFFAISFFQPSQVWVLGIDWNCKTISMLMVFFFFFFFIYGCVGSSFLCEGFLQLWQAGATLHCGARAPHYRGLCCYGAQAPDAQAQQLWLTGPAAPRHVGSSQTRARTRVPCTGRQTPNHCATREALCLWFLFINKHLRFYLIYNWFFSYY